jgi:hypothetical protein
MEKPSLDTLTRRVERLERENRRWKMAGVCAVMLLGLMVLLGATAVQKGPFELRSNRFVLTDKEGRQRASLEILPNEIVRLMTYDRTETQTLSISRKLPTR